MLLSSFSLRRLAGVSLVLTLCFVFSAPAGAAEAGPREAPPKIIIKADDLKKSWDGDVPAPWKKFANFLQERDIRFSIGIICDSLEGNSPKYFAWIKEQQASGRVEFWNHGYDHKEWKEGETKLQEFHGPPYEHQKAHLTKANALAKEKLGFAFTAFGAPSNTKDDSTVKVLEEDPDIKVWLYGDAKASAGKAVLDRVYPVNIENPTFLPSLEKFKAGYAKYASREYFVIQGHPAHWTEDRFAEFAGIIDFLIQEKAVFMTPTQFARDRFPEVFNASTRK